MSPLNQQHPGYQAYLVRLWLIEDEEEAVWRATLENAHTGERQGFPNLEELLNYLNCTTEILTQRIKADRQLHTQ